MSAFVGVNNSGKSSLLKFFYEMRPVFLPIPSDRNFVNQLFAGGQLQTQTPPENADRDEMFFNGNRDGIQIEVCLNDLPKTPEVVARAVVHVAREQSVCKAKFFTVDGSEISAEKVTRVGGTRWMDGVLLGGSVGGLIANFEHIFSAFRMLAETYYVPAFRHISPLTPTEGAVQNYYDINVGRPFIDMWHGLQAGASKRGREQIYRLN